MKTAGKRLFAVDGNSLLYRSYYAIRHLSNSKGFATNAIYGFFLAMRKLIDQEKPDYLGVVFDSKGPTVRHRIYKDYKATRKPMPEDLIPQVPVLKDLLHALNIPYFEMPGYEGDDLLGSLASRAREQEIHTVIVSHDKDLYQLVDKDTSIYHPIKEIYLDSEKVKEIFGVAPAQIVDVLALWGDATDNIPGVAGIGEKTAKSLIREHGSLDSLLGHLDQIRNPRVREKISANLESLQLSRRLVTIETDLDLAFDPAALSLSRPNHEELIPLLKELEFTSLLSGYMQEEPSENVKYEIILDEQQLQGLIARIRKAKTVAFDTETDSPYPVRARLVGMSFAVEPGRAAYLPLGHDYPGAPRQISKDRAFHLLRDIMADEGIKKVGQNLKYDMLVLSREGLAVAGIDRDSMILSYLLEPNWGQHNLKRLSLTYLHSKTLDYHDIAGRGKDEVTMNAVAVESVAPYACQDADLALQLSDLLWEKVRDASLDGLYRDIEQPLIAVLADMEMWGIKVDDGALKKISTELGDSLDELKHKIFQLSGEEFNLNSPQQLAHVLFDKLKLPAGRKTRKTRGFSTSLDVLQDLAVTYPIAQHMLEYRQLAKLKSTYADALSELIHPETGRIHTSYNQTVAATGRLSSSDPNLQNIPVRGEWGTRFRQAFIPAPEHMFLSADYSQIELRVLAHMSEDPNLIDTFVHERDIHQETASQVFGENSGLFPDEPRRRAKIINFSIIYGTSAFSLARELKTTTAEAQRFIDLYFEKYPGVRDFLDRCVRTAEERGYSETLFGRKRQVPELRQQNSHARQAGRRIALNTPIQGTAADLMKKAMIDIWREMKAGKLRSRMMLQVHDELVFEVPKPEFDAMETLVSGCMERVLDLKVPLKVHLGWGINWSEAK